MSEYRIPVNYVHASTGESLGEFDDAWIPPVVGQGWINPSGDRFRIVDVWVNREKHSGGIGEYGIYAYVEPANEVNDRPARMHPHYYIN